MVVMFGNRALNMPYLLTSPAYGAKLVRVNGEL